MSATGSTSPRAFPPTLGIGLTLAGVAAMAGWGLAMQSPASPRLGPREMILAGSVLLALPATLALGLLRRGSWRRVIGLGPLSPRMLGLSVLLGSALWIFSIGLMELQSLALPPPPEYLELFRGIHKALAPTGALDALVSVTVIAVVPGIGEELLTRGILLPSLLRVLRPAGAVAVSALLFAAMHFDVYRFLFTLTIGLVLGVVRLATGSLWPPILAHVTLNAVTFLVAPLVDDPTQTTYTPEPLVGLGCLVVGAAFAVPVMRALRGSVDSSGTEP